MSIHGDAEIPRRASPQPPALPAPVFEQGFKLDDLQRSLPTSVSLGFCDPAVSWEGRWSCFGLVIGRKIPIILFIE